MFLTMPLTTEPSDRVCSSFCRSSPWLASSTARRDTTTLLRLRSSLMTLNSMVLPSNGVVSLTGRISTSEPGRKARMPLAMTVRPPLTLPLITPVTSSPVSRAFSRSIQADRRLALSRDRRVSPKPSSRASIATLTKSPTLASTSPASLRNSSTGMKLSDLSPAFTTTKFISTRTTSAVITSPMRISWRVRLSSNRAAKLFSLEATAGERLDIGFNLPDSPPLRTGLN